MQIFIAVHPSDEPALLGIRFPRAHIAYKIDDYGRLLCADGFDVPEGIMVLSDAGHFAGDALATAAEVLRECRGRRYGAVLMNLTHPELLNALYTLLASNGIAAAVDEGLGSSFPGAWVLVSSALSGGLFAARLYDAVRRFGAGRILLDIEPMRLDFKLPAPDGHCEILSPEALAERMLAFGRARFFSQELCCNYFCYFSGGAPHMVLFDDPASLQRKLDIASRTGILRAVVPYDDGWELVRQAQTGRL